MDPFLLPQASPVPFSATLLVCVLFPACLACLSCCCIAGYSGSLLQRALPMVSIRTCSLSLLACVLIIGIHSYPFRHLT
ncbi:hypothetical protein FKM82_022172 [Ascaphus truei]